MIMFTNMVSGYLDPSVMTYAIQAIAGVVIAIGAVAGIYWRKAKKKVSDKLGIDENKNKEVEGDDIIINSRSPLHQSSLPKKPSLALSPLSKNSCDFGCVKPVRNC